MQIMKLVIMLFGRLLLFNPLLGANISSALYLVVFVKTKKITGFFSLKNSHRTTGH